MSTVPNLKGIKGHWVKTDCPSYACLWDSQFLSQASLSPVSWETSGDMFYIGEHTQINSFLHSEACRNTLLFLTFFFLFSFNKRSWRLFLIYSYTDDFVAWVACALFNWSSVDACWGCLHSYTISSCASVNILAHKAAHKGEQIWRINACMWNGYVERQIHK